MKIKAILRSVAIASAVALVAACGGSDDESGSLTSFDIVPDSYTLQGPDENTCSADDPSTDRRVYIYGGAGPYTIDNARPTLVAIDRSTVDGQGEYFRVLFLGGCFEATVVVVDAFGRKAILELNSEKGEAVTPTTP